MSDNLLSDRVYNWFVGQLHENKLKPGQQLNRRQVADHVGVSVAPVLEAMVRLEAEGFLETVPRRGTHIRPFSGLDVRDQQMLREAVECQAARLICGQRVADEAENLTKLARRADAVHAGPDGPIDWRPEFTFHRALVELAECPPLLDVFDQVVRRALFHAANGMLAPLTPFTPHVDLVIQLQRDDADAAEALMREHIRARDRNGFGRRQPAMA